MSGIQSAFDRIVARFPGIPAPEGNDRFPGVLETQHLIPHDGARSDITAIDYCHPTVLAMLFPSKSSSEKRTTPAILPAAEVNSANLQKKGWACAGFP
jgi:hypothetical protein